MQDLKSFKNKKLKSNLPRQDKQPYDWKMIFHRTLRIGIASGSGFLLFAGALLTSQMLLESGYFGVDQIRVEQYVRVSEGDILDASDIKIGDSLFDLELDMIGSKIEENPWIAKAEVERAFPDQILIRVVEREPRAIIDLDYLYYVDRSGIVFKMLESGDDLGLPVVTGIARESMLEHQEKAQKSLELALLLMDELDTRRVFNLDDVSEIHYDNYDGLTVFTKVGGVPVQMGEDDFKQKLNRLEAIYEDIEPRLMALKYINLNVTDRVIVKIDVKRTTGSS